MLCSLTTADAELVTRNPHGALVCRSLSLSGELVIYPFIRLAASLAKRKFLIFVRPKLSFFSNLEIMASPEVFPLNFL